MRFVFFFFISCIYVISCICCINVEGKITFDKYSGIQDVGPKSVDSFLDTPKPVFVLFYAPWCSHCKTLQPEWEKFAKTMKHVIRVGVIDGDNLKNFAASAGVTAFPTIKYWPLGKEKKIISNGRSYTKQRSYSELKNFAWKEVNFDKVTTVTVLKGRGGPKDPKKSAAEVLVLLEEKAADASTGKVAVWFCSPQVHASTPPFWPVMPWNTDFEKTISFVTVFIHPQFMEDKEQKELLKRLKFKNISQDTDPDEVSYFKLYNDELDELSMLNRELTNRNELAVDVGRWLYKDGLGTPETTIEIR